MIKVFSTPKCIHCKEIKDWLDERRVQHTFVDMTKVSPQEQLKLQITSVPVIEYNGKRISTRELKSKYGS